MQVDFYHLGASGVERVLPRIAERVLADGARLLIVAADDALAERLDRALWDHAPESFLPHGRDDAARQPVLIAATADPTNGARHVALADGVWRDDALGFERAFHLFGDAEIAEARAAWKALAARDGIERRFWRQDEAGKWRQQA